MSGVLLPYVKFHKWAGHRVVIQVPEPSHWPQTRRITQQASLIVLVNRLCGLVSEAVVTRLLTSIPRQEFIVTLISSSTSSSMP